MLLRRANARLTEVEIDGEVAVYHPGTDKVVLLNASASEIWRRTPITSFEQLSEAVAEVFGIEVEQALAGVRTGIELLLAEQLLVDVETSDEDDAPPAIP